MPISKPARYFVQTVKLKTFINTGIQYSAYFTNDVVSEIRSLVNKPDLDPAKKILYKSEKG